MKLAILITLALAGVALADPRSDARAHVDKATRLHDAGKYTDALAELEIAYRLDPQPDLLYAIAQVHVGMNDCAQAIAFYRRYLYTKPKPATVEIVNEAIATCEKESAPPPVPDVDQVPRQPHTRARRDLKPAGLVTAGAGAVLVATGLLFGRQAKAYGEEVTADCHLMTCMWTKEKSKESNGKRDATVGRILDGVGLAAVAAGIGMYIYGRREQQPTLAIQPDTHGATLTWSARW